MEMRQLSLRQIPFSKQSIFAAEVNYPQCGVEATFDVDKAVHLL